MLFKTASKRLPNPSTRPFLGLCKASLKWVSNIGLVGINCLSYSHKIPNYFIVRIYHKLKQLNLKPLEDRRTFLDVSVMFHLSKGAGGLHLHDLYTMQTVMRSTRHGPDPLCVVVPRANTDVRRGFFTCRAAVAWNRVPYEIKISPNKHVFKKKYWEWMGTLES